MRYIVGGAQKVVMRYLANSGRMSAASKRSKSYTNVAASHSHWPYSLPHMRLGPAGVGDGEVQAIGIDAVPELGGDGSAPADR